MPSLSPNILLVHGNAEMRAFLGAQLPDRCRLRMAAGKEDALRHLQKVDPDLMIVDADIVPRGGRALWEATRQKDDSPPILLLEERRGDEASEASENGPEEHVSARADEVLGKPFLTSALRRRVEQLLSGIPTGDDLSENRPVPGRIVEKALQVIEERLSDPDLTAGEVAEAVDVSRRHLSRRLKATVGEPTAALIRARRIERAKRELRTRPDTIADVADTVGF